MARSKLKTYRTASSSYEIGYKRPPLNTRYKKGQSGNPSGRRRRKWSTFDDMMAEEMNSKIAFVENGGRRKSTKIRLMIKHAVNQAVKGDFKPLALLFKLDNRLKMLTPATKLRKLSEETDLKNLSTTELSDLYRRAIRGV